MNKILTIGLLTSSIALAGTGLNCSETKSMHKNAIEACVIQTDDILNANYKELMNDSLFSNIPHNKKALKSAQKTWLKFRDASCELKLSLGQASSNKEEILNLCMVEVTIQRNDELEALIEEYIAN